MEKILLVKRVYPPTIHIYPVTFLYLYTVAFPVNTLAGLLCLFVHRLKDVRGMLDLRHDLPCPPVDEILCCVMILILISTESVLPLAFLHVP
jgi:hypothetical protein